MIAFVINISYIIWLLEFLPDCHYWKTKYLLEIHARLSEKLVGFSFWKGFKTLHKISFGYLFGPVENLLLHPEYQNHDRTAIAFG